MEPNQMETAMVLKGLLIWLVCSRDSLNFKFIAANMEWIGALQGVSNGNGNKPKAAGNGTANAEGGNKPAAEGAKPAEGGAKPAEGKPAGEGAKPAEGGEAPKAEGNKPASEAPKGEAPKAEGVFITYSISMERR